jgi:hypothetical protein
MTGGLHGHKGCMHDAQADATATSALQAVTEATLPAMMHM